MYRDFKSGVTEFDEAFETLRRIMPETQNLFEYLRMNHNNDENIRDLVIAAQVELISPLLKEPTAEEAHQAAVDFGSFLSGH